MKNQKNILRYFKKIIPTILFLFFILFLITATTNTIGSPNDASRIATIKNLVEEKTLNINKTNYGPYDIIKREGNFYSSKPPVLSVIGSGAYYLIYNFLNLELPEHNFPKEPNTAYYLLTLFLVGIPYLLLLFYFYKTLKMFKIKVFNKILLTIGLGVGTLYLSYSTTLNNHISAGSFLFISFYYLLKIKFNHRDKNIKKYIALSGFFVSLAAVIDLPTGLIFSVLFFFYYYLTNKKRYLTYYILALLPIILIHLFINVQITGDILPAQLHPNFYNFENSYWNETSGADNYNDPIWLYSFNILFGSHGLFFYNPLLILSVYAIFKSIKDNTSFKKEAIMLTLGFSILFLYYTLKVKSYGGSSYGFRWFIAIIPLIYFYIIFLFTDKKYIEVINFFIPLLIISTLISLTGAIDPWSPTSIIIGSEENFTKINSSFFVNFFRFFILK
jgi:hypothetical protein